MTRRLAIPVLLLTACFAASCGRSDDDRVDVVVIGTAEGLFAKGIRLADAGQYLRAATVDGLVGLDARGEVVPGLAERWIVTDEGRSYLFRLAQRSWPDGAPLTSETVREALLAARRDLRGTSLGLDLAKIADVRAMAGRVVEIRLAAPMPDLLQLLAQPELGLYRKGRGSGAMILRREVDAAILTPVAPVQRGLPAEPGWEKRARPLRLRALPAAAAVGSFAAGEADIVLGGRIENLALADSGPLSRATVRLDGVTGLLGLEVASVRGFLAEASRREAVAMAIDRDALTGLFNVDGWMVTSRIVPPGLPGELGAIGERWAGLTIGQRRAEAARRVAQWRKTASVEAVSLSIAMPEGPGADVIFARLRSDLAAIGVEAQRSAPGAPADLVWVDRVARIADPRWFLNQFHCSLRPAICSQAADARVAEAVRAQGGAAAALLAEAEAELTAVNGYIPIGAPLRWSMVRGSVTGFAPNRAGIHALAALAVSPR